MMVKICGITNMEDAMAAVEAGASALGFNFWPGSPRYLAPEAARRISGPLPPGISKVGVFVNESAEAIAAAAGEAGADVVQLHGDCGAPEGWRRWRALGVGASFDASVLEEPGVEAFLLDAPAGERYGGTGVGFDWALLTPVRQKIILAGGLDAANVGAAIAAVRPWGVDACSRLESSPGRKDHARMRAFVAAALGRNQR